MRVTSAPLPRLSGGSWRENGGSHFRVRSFGLGLYFGVTVRHGLPHHRSPHEALHRVSKIEGDPTLYHPIGRVTIDLARRFYRAPIEEPLIRYSPVTIYHDYHALYYLLKIDYIHIATPGASRPVIDLAHTTNSTFPLANYSLPFITADYIRDTREFEEIIRENVKR